MKPLFLSLPVLLSMSFLIQAGALKLASADTQSGSLADMYYLRAQEHIKEGDIDLAFADYTKAKEFDPVKYAEPPEGLPKLDDAAKWIRRANESMYPGEKLRCYKKALEIDPVNTTARYRLARSHFKLNQYDEAIANLESLLETDSKHKKGRRLLKKVRKKRAKKEENKNLASDDLEI